MAENNFIDSIKIYCKSGNGGAGSRHFLREKFKPNGGPDGGNGGRGGHIIVKGNSQMWTLLHLRYRKHINAENGYGGEKNRASGAQGEDIIIEVPLGTIAKDSETGEILLEIMEDKQELILLEGGKGGYGNDYFKTATNQAPQYAQPGIPGQEKWIQFELKILADVGFVGFPNAGKSTLLSVISAAKPHIAPYPFTTIQPNIGVVKYKEHRSFIAADIPGIIEGAAEGKGLGLQFIRHIERNTLLLFIIPIDSTDIQNEYRILLHELVKYNPHLLDKKRLLAISKCDMVDEEFLNSIKQQLPQEIEHVFISSITQQGINTLKDTIWKLLNS